jgi:hypothetical protein
MRALTALLLVASVSLGQEAPRKLPAEFAEPTATEIGSLVGFDPDALTLKRVNNRNQLWAGNQLLKDFGVQESEARDALRLIRDMGYNQYGTIPGATPAFEFWLRDGEALKGGLAVRNVVPFNAAAIQVENISGAWVVRDDKMMLYNFGTQRQAAEQAFAVLRKFQFSQLGVIGLPNPAMTYLVVGNFARPPQSPVPSASPAREIVQQVAQQGLMIPEVGYVGARTPIDQRKLDVAKVGVNWVLVHDKETLGHFGPNMNDARAASRMLLNAHITEVVRVGKSGFPIYLSNGQPPRSAGLGFNNIRLQPSAMKAQMVNNVACLVEEGRIVFELPSMEDAELLLRTLRHFKIDQISPIGDLRLALKTR